MVLNMHRVMLKKGGKDLWDEPKLFSRVPMINETIYITEKGKSRPKTYYVSMVHMHLDMNEDANNRVLYKVSVV